MDELLFGYLLEALDDDDRRSVDEQLARDPAARDRLEALRAKLQPLAIDADDIEPPPGLVVRTVARVAEVRVQAPATLPLQAPAVAPSAVAGGRRWFRRLDVLATAAIVLIVGMLTVPWMVRLRHEAQVRECQRNMALFWNAFQVYGEVHDKKLPGLEKDGPRSFAGVFVPMLGDAGVLSNEVSILCPAVGRRAADSHSLKALEGYYTEDTSNLSALERYYADKGPEEYRVVVREIGGSYAYPLGYIEGDHLTGLRCDDGDSQPLLADVPCVVSIPGGSVCEANSLTHGRPGQNVLYVGGNVRWCTTRTVGYDGDDIFVNQDHQIRAGLNRFDAVLASGDARPVPYAVP
jgi:hypothetical protein